MIESYAGLQEGRKKKERFAEFKKQIAKVTEETNEDEELDRISTKPLYEDLKKQFQDSSPTIEEVSEKETLLLLKGVLKHGEHNIRMVCKDDSVAASYKALALKWQCIKL